MRGKETDSCPVSVVNGIIPAHAGKSIPELQNQLDE